MRVGPELRAIQLLSRLRPQDQQLAGTYSTRPAGFSKLTAQIWQSDPRVYAVAIVMFRRPPVANTITIESVLISKILSIPKIFVSGQQKTVCCLETVLVHANLVSYSNFLQQKYILL